MTLSAEILNQLIIALMLSAARFGAIFVIVPYFNPELIQGTIRILITLTLTATITPITYHALHAAPSLPLTLVCLLFLKEAILGLILGVLNSLAFAVAEGIGVIIDTQRGSNMAQMFDPLSNETSTPLGLLFFRLILTYFFVGGGFLAFLGLVYESFSIWPILSFFPSFNPSTPSFFLSCLDKYFSDIILLASPILIILLLVELGLGFMNRFAPQLNVFSLGMPIKSGVAVFILVLYLSTLYKLFQIGIINQNGLIKKTLNLFSS